MLAPCPSPVRPPQQERSRRTLRRILSATERLLEKRPFEEIGVQQIVRSAAHLGGLVLRTLRGQVGPSGRPLRTLRRGSRSAHRDLARDPSGPRSPAWAAPAPGSRSIWWTAFASAATSCAPWHSTCACDLKLPAEATGERRAEQHAFLEEALLEHCDEIEDPDP